MSYAAIKWTYMSPHVLNAGLNPTQLAVLRALCWFYKDKGCTKYGRNCYVSVETLAKTIGKATDAVDRAKRVLQAKGFIEWDRSANLKTTDRKTNSYRIFCPELEKILERNEKRLMEGHPPNEDDLMKDHPLRPGMLYFRPDPAALEKAFSPPLNHYEAEWMADALAFVCDRPEHRQQILAAMRNAPDLAFCRKTLKRVLATSLKGRRINNRLCYLLAALKPKPTDS